MEYGNDDVDLQVKLFLEENSSLSDEENQIKNIYFSYIGENDLIFLIIN